MIADEYGYAVLPGQAVTTPGVEAVLRRRERTGVVWAVSGLVVQGVPAAVLLPAEGAAGAVGVMLAITFTVTDSASSLKASEEPKEEGMPSGDGGRCGLLGVEGILLLATLRRRR